MAPVDLAAFFVPAVFVIVLWRGWAHFRRHRVALTALILLTVVSVLHFDVGMLASDPYESMLDSIGAPRRTWAASVIVLLLLSYSGDVSRRLRGRAVRGGAAPPSRTSRDARRERIG